MFSGDIDLKEDTVENLLSTARLLQMSEVVEACCGFLMKQLHPSNCIGIRQFADTQGCIDLYKVANNYVMVRLSRGTDSRVVKAGMNGLMDELILVLLKNPFRLSFSEPKCVRGRHILFLESIFQHSPEEIVQLNINHNSYNKKRYTFYEG